MFKKTWLAFCFIFLVLAIFHLWLSTHTLPLLDIKADLAKISGIPTANKMMDEFQNEVNDYIKNYNESLKWQNIAATVGYFGALLIAFLSFLYISNILSDRRRIHIEANKVTKWILLIAVSVICVWLIHINKKFFESYKDVFSVFSFLLLVIGLIFTWVQISAAKRRTRANTSYQIRKDGREIFISLSDEVRNYIEGIDREVADLEKVRTEAEMKIHEILMFYASVYQQLLLDVIDKEFFSNVIVKDLCNFLSRDKVKQYWETNIVGNEAWREEFVQIGQRCFNGRKEG